MQEVGALPTRRQRGKGFFQCGERVQFAAKFFGNVEFFGLFQRHFQAGFFRFDSRADVRLQDGFHVGYLLNAGEADLASRLGIFCLRDEDVLRILQQRSFEEQECTVRIESMDQDDVAVADGVAGLAPLQLFRQATVQNDRPQCGFRRW